LNIAGVDQLFGYSILHGKIYVLILTKTGCGLHSGQFFSKIRLEPILETTSE
jgi:hypothetical protein